MGLEDFGEELNNTNSSQKANHALVLMWQSLADNFVQPIAVFASHGTVKGVDLAKLVIRAILLMENAGGQVVGLTSDGATTNRTMWNLLGICPNSENFKNYFENPYDSSRKVFVFSDTPHLLKTIRNRLYEKKQLLVHPSKTPIKWEHYQNVYKIEANSLTKACPKINKNHFELNNLSKMKVKYAAQVLKEAFAFINEWESNLKNQLITKNDFLTQMTADGLKITLKSTMDLVDYLLNECNYKYVMTTKLNQDCLEKFFGIIRQVAGPNDHPSTPTFLQLYRMLSMYSLIKPPKSGNCTIFEDNIPMITIADLKEIINDSTNTPARINKIEKLKLKINTIVGS
ncbi:unnamed protein product [Aphis gossypii]|uniref:Transposable element P transposase n=1 Tax=Aphis gossypii TaxID=80765 RepID=A0A9P0JHA9_APHGO|nr:unnamed protein product [Aphis gossypii]